MTDAVEPTDPEDTLGHNPAAVAASSASHRIITLFGPINAEAAYTVWAGLLQYGLEDPKAPISIYMSTPGGDVYEAFSIWDAIQACPAPVNLIGVGCVASCGAFLMYAAPKGRRFLAPNTVVMAHQISYGDYGRMTELKSRMAAVEVQEERFMSLIVAKTTLKGSKESKLKKLAKYWQGEHDQYMFPQEAIEKLGIADHIGLPHQV